MYTKTTTWLIVTLPGNPVGENPSAGCSIARWYSCDIGDRGVEVSVRGATRLTAFVCAAVGVLGTQ